MLISQPFVGFSRTPVYLDVTRSLCTCRVAGLSLSLKSAPKTRALAPPMDHEFLQKLNIDQYPFDPHYALGLRALFGDKFQRELTPEEITELGSVTFCPLLFGNRSGSNLLSDSLFRAGLGFPEHGEPLNVPSVERISNRHNLKTFTDYFLFLTRQWRKHDVVGFKISIGQLFDLTRTGLLSHFASTKLLHSVRRDRVAQAVSHYIAKASGNWSSKSGDSNQEVIPYSAEDILRFLRRGARLQADYDLYQTIHGFDGMEIWYEDLIRHPQDQVSAVAEFLGSPADLTNLDLESAATRSQTSALKEEFAARFRSDLSGSGVALS